MIRIISCLLAAMMLLSTAVMSFAETGKECPKRKEICAQLIERLDLTNEQKPKVEAIFETASEKRKAIMGDTRWRSLPRSERKEKREQMKQVAKKVRDNLAKVLTVEQMKTYDATVKEFRKKIRGRFKRS